MRISDWSSDVCSSDLGSWCCAVTPRSGTAPAGIGWILSAPAVVIIALLAILPSLHLLIEAFRSIDTEGLTLENFAGLLDSRIAAQAFWRTLRVAAVTTVLTILEIGRAHV